MTINIQSLFSDIIETPAQRQERLMMEGVLQSRQITGGITNPMVPTALASTIAQRAPQRQENIRRSVGGLLGLDVRTDSERVQEALSGVDPSNPESILQAAQMIGNMGLGAQAAQMRQMAAELLASQSQAMQKATRANNIIRYAQGLVSNNPELVDLMPNLDPETALDVAKEYVDANKDPDRSIFLETITTEDGERKLVMFDRNDPDFRRDIETLAPQEEEIEISPLSSSEREIYKMQLESVDEMKDLRGVGITRFRKVDDAVIYDRLARVRSENPDMTPREHVEMLAKELQEELDNAESSEIQEAQKIAGTMQSNGVVNQTDIANIEALAEQAAAARQAASARRRRAGRR